MINKVARITLAFLLVGASVAPAWSQSNKDVENIGNRDINGGVFSNWNFTSWEKEIALGRQLAAELERTVRIVDDPVINEYVNRVGQNLVRNSDAMIPFTFKVIDDDSVNAMALPGGFVYVHTGILRTADEEAELAGVMAHEIAHVTARHGTENQTKATIANIATIPLIFLGGVGGIAAQSVASIGIPMSFMQFSRKSEEEADYLGSQYMWKTGYDPGAAVTFFEKVQARESARPGTVSSLFSSHPPTEDRIEKTKETIANVLPANDRYVLTTSEFDTVKARLVAYENRERHDEEEESTRPTLRRRTPRPEAPSDIDSGEDAGPPRLERSGGDTTPEADAPEADGSSPDSVAPPDDDRPVLKRN